MTSDIIKTFKKSFKAKLCSEEDERERDLKPGHYVYGPAFSKLTQFDG